MHSQCKECFKVGVKKHRAKNRDHYLQYKREWHQRNRESENKRKREWFQDNKEVATDYLREWQKDNKDKLVQYRIQREANKAHEITDEEWESCLSHFNYSCAYCGMSQQESLKAFNQRLHREHVDHEGANDLSNNIPACKSCNSSKGNKEVKEFIESNNIENERIDKILKWIEEDYKRFIK